jgi:hypothetical protein
MFEGLKEAVINRVLNWKDGVNGNFYFDDSTLSFHEQRSMAEHGEISPEYALTHG